MDDAKVSVLVASRRCALTVRRLQLGQDMFLIGSPGPERRRLAFRFAEILQREVEYLPITRDTSESDLKQRRELRGGGVVFVDQAPVRAALHGRLLIIDGIERAERNVLPTINNLLENREMNLEDGRTLVILHLLLSLHSLIM